jgi:hypothetical protein
MPALVQCPQFWVCFACLLAVYSANAAPGTEGDAVEVSEAQWHKRSIPKHKKEKHGQRHEAELEEGAELHEGHKHKKGKNKKQEHKPILVEEHEPCPEEHIEPAYHHVAEPYSVPVPVPVEVPHPQPYPVYIREPYPVYVVKVAKARPQSAYPPVNVRSRYELLSRPHFK